MFIVTGKNWLAHHHLENNTSELPNVHWWTIFQPKDDFRCSVESALNVNKTAASGIETLNVRETVYIDNDFFRFHVEIDDRAEVILGEIA
jgi:hypothetical protein